MSRTSWESVSLSDIISEEGVFVDGDWVESKDQNPNGSIRLTQLADIGVGDFLDRSHRFLTKEKASELKCTYIEHGDILVARMPDPIGRACIFPGIEQRCVTVVDVCIIRPNNSNICNRWLMWTINSPRFKQQLEQYLTGTTRQRISRKNLQKLKIPLPPIEEQRRIAAILDKADAVRRKRKQAIQYTEDLLRSAFLDMFGDLNKTDWPIETVEDIAANHKGAIRTGPFGSQLLHSEFVDSGIPVLGIDNVVKNEFLWAKPRFISEEKYESLERYTVNSGDVLISIMGTCGRCAIVPEQFPIAINTKHLCCITIDKNKCIPEFLHSYFLIHPKARNFLERNAKGAIMNGLNMGIIKQLPVVLPPIKAQKQFKSIIRSIRTSKTDIKSAEDQDNNLFNSLLQRAFKGEL